MSNLPIKDFFNKEGVKNKFAELLGEKAAGFGTSVLQVVNGNSLLQKATPESVFNAAVMAATLDLPINNNLGFAWIVPYGGTAQFQVGWKGFVQLAQRSGQYRTINAVPVYENQFRSFNRLSEDLDADFTIQGAGNIVAFAGHFQTITGFTKTVCWTVDEVKAHGKKFSKTFNQKNGVWETNFEAMAMKTVIKNMLAKWGPLSIEMQKAVISDQSIIKDVDTMDVEYVDNDPVQITDKPTLTDDEVAQAYTDGLTLDALTTDYSLTDEQTKMFE